MLGLYWRLTAERLVLVDPARMAAATVAGGFGSHPDQESLDILGRALGIEPEPVWRILGQALLSRDVGRVFRMTWAARV
jgi:hypothetical protein